MIRNMNEVLIQRIQQLLKETGKSTQAASKEATGASETLRKILDGTTKNPRIDTLQKIAHVLGTTRAYLVGETDIKEQQIERAESETERPISSEQSFSTSTDIPVMGTAAGSHLGGAFQFEGGVIDYVRRPPALFGAKDIYALFVDGSSMEPQYFPGDLIYVNPNKPAKIGDIVVIQCRNDSNSPMEASLAILVRRTEKSVTIGKRNPAIDIEISRDTIKHIHRVLTVNELFGK